MSKMAALNLINLILRCPRKSCFLDAQENLLRSSEQAPHLTFEYFMPGNFATNLVFH
jgi:hypothetical protein